MYTITPIKNIFIHLYEMQRNRNRFWFSSVFAVRASGDETELRHSNQTETKWICEIICLAAWLTWRLNNCSVYVRYKLNGQIRRLVCKRRCTRSTFVMALIRTVIECMLSTQNKRKEEKRKIEKKSTTQNVICTKNGLCPNFARKLYFEPFQWLVHFKVDFSFWFLFSFSIFLFN